MRRAYAGQKCCRGRFRPPRKTNCLREELYLLELPEAQLSVEAHEFPDLMEAPAIRRSSFPLACTLLFPSKLKEAQAILTGSGEAFIKDGAVCILQRIKCGHRKAQR